MISSFRGILTSITSLFIFYKFQNKSEEFSERQARMKRVSFELHGFLVNFFIEDLEVDERDQKLLRLGRNLSNSWDKGISGDMAMPQRLMCVLDRLGLGICRGKHFADIGCGSGRILFWASIHFPLARITGIDINKNSIEIAQLLSKDRFTCINGNACETMISGLDMIYCFNEGNNELTMALEKYIEESPDLRFIICSSVSSSSRRLLKRIGKFPFRIFGTTQTRYMLIYRRFNIVVL